MIGRLSIFAALTLLALPAQGWAADGQQPQAGNQAYQGQAFGDIRARATGEPVLLASPDPSSQWLARFGWWALWTSGSPQKVGEYQGLDSNAFWDVDGLSSDGTRTLSVTATGGDDETTSANIYFYRPGLSARVDYDRFVHRLDHDPLNNLADLNTTLANNPGGNDPLSMRQDLNVGQDFVMRVQELDASFKVLASDNLKVRLDVWGIKKEGTRQNIANGMCYNRNVAGANLPPDHLGPGGTNLGTFTGARCHVLSQGQHIDWVTTEIKPVIELRVNDDLAVEYSRPMRGFSADDQLATRFYNVTGRLTFNPATNPDPYATGVVPESYTEMDQLKISGQLTEATSAYAYLMVGRTIDREIAMDRWFNAADVRLTNTAIENTTLTGYAKFFNEGEEAPVLANVKALERYNPTTFNPVLAEPIDYHRTSAGLKGVWRPRGGGISVPGLALIGGYEYADLERENAIFTSTNGAVTLEQLRTITHSFQVGPRYRWSPCFDTFLRYKFQDADQPLIGFQGNGTTNTLLPEHDNIVEVGFDWFPDESFMLNAVLGIESADHNSPYAHFTEERYPFSINGWYAVNQRLSLSAGYALFSNFVAQDINIGQDPAGTLVPPVTAPWRYGARAQVVTLGSRYAATERVSLTGLVEWVRGHNLVHQSATTFPSGITVTDLGGYSEVLNETTRLSLGADWVLRPRVVTFCRYELYNFNDMAPDFQTGLMQGVLGGVSALF